MPKPTPIKDPCTNAIWLGIGETSKIVLLSLSTFAPICFAAQAGVRSVPIERINAALSLGASRLQLFKFILPSHSSTLASCRPGEHGVRGEPASV